MKPAPCSVGEFWSSMASCAAAVFACWFLEIDVGPSIGSFIGIFYAYFFWTPTQ